MAPALTLISASSVNPARTNIDLGTTTPREFTIGRMLVLGGFIATILLRCHRVAPSSGYRQLADG